MSIDNLNIHRTNQVLKLYKTVNSSAYRQTVYKSGDTKKHFLVIDTRDHKPERWERKAPKGETKRKAFFTIVNKMIVLSNAVDAGKTTDFLESLVAAVRSGKTSVDVAFTAAKKIQKVINDNGVSLTSIK